MKEFFKNWYRNRLQQQYIEEILMRAAKLPVDKQESLKKSLLHEEN